MNLLLIGGLGTSELIVIAVIILILFGGSKLPGLMRGAGKGIREFKDAMNGDKEDAKSNIVDAEEVKDSDSKK